MLDRFLVNLGLTEDAVTAKSLNGKFIAILKHSGKTGDPKIIVVKEETELPNDEDDKSGTLKLGPGDILAHSNPIYIQEIIAELYPEYAGANNQGGKHIQLCYIPQKLSHF